MKSFSAFALAAAVVLTTSSLPAETWQPSIGDANWGDAVNWSPASVPNAVGASATFNAPTGTRTVSLGTGNNYTVGSINATIASFSTSIRNNVGTTQTRGAASLTFDAAGTGPVLITVDGTGTNQYLITADMHFNDTVDVNVLSTTGNANAGAISLTGDITGTGGLTKDGSGTMTMAFISGQNVGVKNFQGPTVINNGRFRHSFGGTPTSTSSVTVNNGGQIDWITNNQIYQYGTSANTELNLNGFGPTTGPNAPFPGAIRPDTNLVISLANKVVLQSDSMIHVQGTSAALTVLNAVSGPGRLVVGAVPHDTNLGELILQNTDSYTGGTTVQAGTLTAQGASVNAFGTGSMQVVSANLATPGSQAHVHIVSGATDAIRDTAYLNLAGGNSVGADDGYIDLDSGVNETVGGLMLGGVIQPAGTYGSTSSTATFQNDEFFAGSGVINVVPSGVPGDYNSNGVVDAADYVTWRNGGSLANDFTPGNQPSDYDFWRSRFGATTNPGSGASLTTAAVPEPTALALAGIVLTLFAAVRRRVG